MFNFLNHKNYTLTLITTRSGKVIGKGIRDNLVIEEEVLSERENEKEQFECEGGEERNKEDIVNLGEKKEKYQKMKNKR